MELFTNPDKINEQVVKAVNISREMYRDLEKSDKDKDILAYLVDDSMSLKTLHSITYFLSIVSSDEKVRETCKKADKLLSGHNHWLNDKKEFYLELFEKSKIKNKNDQHFLKKLKQGINNYCPEKDIMHSLEDKVKSLMNRSILFNVKDSEVKFFPKGLVRSGKILINNHNYNILLRSIGEESIRKRLQQEYESIDPKTIVTLLQLFHARHKYAVKCGYPDYVSMASSNNVLNDFNQIKSFLTKMLNNLDKPFIKEFAKLERLKKSSNIGDWDVSYLMNLWKKQYGSYPEKVAEYFTFKHVVKYTFKKYQDLFGVKIKKKKFTLWDDNVEIYRVQNKDKSLLGHFCLDLFERKYKTASTGVYEILPRGNRPYRSKTVQFPISCLVMHLKKSSIKKMSFDSVMNFFSEMAHIMHHMVHQSPLSQFSGINGNLDCVNISSQIMENICWEHKTISDLSSKYVNHEKLPNKDIDKLIETRKIEIGISLKKHILMATFDQLVHSKQFIEATKPLLHNQDQAINALVTIYQQVHDMIMKNSTSLDETLGIKRNENYYPPSRWLFLGSSLSGSYYSIIWSMITSSDIYYSKMKNAKSREFNRSFFQWDPNENTSDKIYYWLGRKADVNSFLRLYGITNMSEYSIFFKSEKNKSKKKTKKGSREKSKKDVIRETPIELTDSDSIELNTDSEYMTENTETLQKYKSIFKKKY